MIQRLRVVMLKLISYTTMNLTHDYLAYTLCVNPVQVTIECIAQNSPYSRPG